MCTERRGDTSTHSPAATMQLFGPSPPGPTGETSSALGSHMSVLYVVDSLDWQAANVEPESSANQSPLVAAAFTELAQAI